MFEWLQTLPDWEEALVMILGFAALLGVFAIAVLTLVKGGRFRVSRHGLEIDPVSGKPVRGRKKSPHENCPHVSDIILVLDKVTEVSEKVFEIKYMETLKEQMSFAEEKSIQIRGILDQVFLNLLAETYKAESLDGQFTDANGAGTLLSHPDYRVYTLCLDKLMAQNMDYVKTAFKENHYAEVDEITFDRYAVNKAETIIQMSTSLLNSAYFGTQVTRPTLYKANMAEAVSKIKSLLYDVFLNARHVANEKLKKIDALHKERKEFIILVLGVEGMLSEEKKK